MLLDVRQAALSFYDSLFKVSQMAVQSKGTVHSLGKRIIFRCFDISKMFRVFKVIVIVSSFDLFIRYNGIIKFLLHARGFFFSKANSC